MTTVSSFGSYSYDFESCWSIIDPSWENLVISECAFSLDPLSCPSLNTRYSMKQVKNSQRTLKRCQNPAGRDEELLLKDSNHINS